MGKYLEEIIPNECKMSDRKRSRKHHEDRHEKKKHKESKQDEGKYQHQTRKLIQEVQKLKHVETLWVFAAFLMLSKRAFNNLNFCSFMSSQKFLVRPA